MHSAKGGEWGVVHLIHAADGAFPSDMATGDAEGVDEERRLFYVALTRAKRHLHVYAPLRYHHGDPAGRTDRHSYALRTRFLPPDVDPLLDLRVVRGVEDVALPPVQAPAHRDRRRRTRGASGSRRLPHPRPRPVRGPTYTRGPSRPGTAHLARD